MISKTIACIVRGTQVVFAVIIVGLVGDIFANSYWNQIPRGEGNPSQINYSMFIGVWTLISACYFFPSILWPPVLKQPFLYITAGLDGLNTIFYMGGAIALAAGMNIHSCSNTTYIRGNKITKGAPDKVNRCREAQALTAFLWFNFLVFVVTTVFSVREIFLDATGLDGGRDKSQNQKNEDPETMTGGPMVTDELVQPTGARRNFFSFLKNEGLKDGGPPVAVVTSEVGTDTDIRREQVIESEPETADYDHHSRHDY
jgi:hypothetical protein